MDIQLKAKNENDSEFFFQLFGEIKIAELNAGGCPDHMKFQLVSMQFNAYEFSIKNEYPDADDYVIMFNSERAGRLQLNRNESGLRVINISLLPAFHNKGIGSRILNDILAEADLSNKPVYLEVDRVNPALHLYYKFGFEIFHQDELKFGMRYLPKTI